MLIKLTKTIVGDVSYNSFYADARGVRDRLLYAYFLALVVPCQDCGIEGALAGTAVCLTKMYFRKFTSKYSISLRLI